MSAPVPGARNAASLLLAGAIFAATATTILTGLVRATVARSMLDHPNERSSHAAPVPRGGGIAIVVVVMLFVLWAGVTHTLDVRTTIAMLGGGSAIAVAGFLDDRKSLAVNLRLAVQFAAAVWSVAWLGGMRALRFGTPSTHPGIIGAILATFGIVWATNLFNFMDGIDGIAGIEALTAGAAGGALLVWKGAFGLGSVAVVVAAAAVGFLRWNWQPARIFMGDVGSAFLGFMFATLAIASENSGTLPLFGWVILMGVFIFDATVTLARRVPSGSWAQAHRTHAYQRAVQAGWSHAAVSLAVASLNVMLGVIALTVVAHPSTLMAGLALAVILLGVVYALIGRVRPFPAAERPATAKPG